MKKTFLHYLTVVLLLVASNIQELLAQQSNANSFIAPVILDVFGSSPQTLKVNFVDTNVGESGYLFYYSTSPDGPFQIDDLFPQSGLDSGSVISYQTNSGYDPNTLLYLKVAAFDYNNETGEYAVIGPFSELDTARTMAGWPPGPSDFMATPEGGHIRLTWTDNSKPGDPLDEAVWGLSRSTDGSNFNKGYSLPAETETFVDNDVTPYVTYYYRLEPYNVFGVGNFIYGASAMALPVAEAPTVPATNLSFSNVLSTSMIVSFTPGNGLQHLVVMKAGAPPTFKPADGTTYVTSQDLGQGETVVSISNESTINVAGLKPFTRYHFTVFESGRDSVGTIRYLTDNAPVASTETTVSVSDFGIYKWNGIGWDNLPGVNAIRIAVDGNGNPWVVNSNHDIYQYVNNAFIQRPGKANDIGIGGGQVWIIGVEPVRTDVDYKIYKWNGAGWDNLPGGGVKIAVDANGQPWVTNSVKNIYRYVNNAWLLMPGLANDIGIGGGIAWVLGTNSVGSGSDFGVYSWNGSDWINLPGGGVNITADENGQPWVTNSVKDIYQFVNGAWKKLPGQANDIGIGGEKACIIGNAPSGEALTTPVLYGLTSANGQLEIGSVFTSNLDGSELKSIYNFNTATSRRPIGSLLLGTDGFLYGMARSTVNDSGQGTIFKINVDGSGYNELHKLDAYPSASSLIQTTDGTLFGMTSPFENGLQGRLFKINADGSSYQNLRILGSGGEPGFLMQASNGSIYGTDASTGFGNIFRMNADGSGYTVLHNFNGSDGSFAYGALTEATDGALYGVTSQGGPANIGTIYKINTNGTGFTVLHNFYLSQEGVTPSESLVQAPNGSPYLYGMTLTGGQYNSGVIYKISMTGDGYTVLHTFNGSDGARPACKLIHIGNKLYGYTTNGGLSGGGVIFNYDLETSSYHKLADFTAATGMNPVFGGLLLIRPATIDKPTIPASNISFSNVLSTSMTVSFTPGNGTRRLALLRAGSAPALKPVDYTSYAGKLANGDLVIFNGAETTFKITGLSSYRRYYVTVFEYNTDSLDNIKYLVNGAPVASQQTRLLPKVYVTKPGNGAINQYVKLTLKAKEVSGANTYTFEISNNASFASAKILSGGITQMLDSLHYNTLYYARVKTNLRDDYGKVTTFTTRTAESLAYVTSPANGAVNVNTKTAIASNAVPYASQYTIQLSETNDFAIVAFEATGSSRILHFPELKSNTTYYSRVRVNLGLVFGGVRSFTTGNTLTAARIASDGEAELSEFALTVYPNPFQEKLTLYIESSRYDEAKVTLMDLTGRTVHEFSGKTNSPLEIERNLVDGVYLLRVNAGGFNKQIRVVKIQ